MTEPNEQNRPARPTAAERRAAARAADPYAPADCRTCLRCELDCCDPHEENW